jgi:hypothetical protein
MGLGDVFDPQNSFDPSWPIDKDCVMIPAEKILLKSFATGAL